MLGAVAHWLVVGHLTQCFSTTSTHTWVTALNVDAGQMAGTLGVADTLGAAIRWLIIIVRKTLTHWAFLHHTAVGVWSTRAWVAWVYRLWW